MHLYAAHCVEIAILRTTLFFQRNSLSPGVGAHKLERRLDIRGFKKNAAARINGFEIACSSAFQALGLEHAWREPKS